ncbi:MAG: M28 family metallopeptidase [Candidatus Cyclobacteriaceae bacterium M2_1C_046]
MKKLYIVLLFLITTNLSYAQDKKFARAIIDSLAAPQMHGRGYVNNGDSLAAAYIANIFDSLGLEKLTDNYFQDFHIGVNTLPGVVRIKIGKDELTPGTDYLIDPGSPSVRGKYKLVFVDEKELEQPNEYLSSLKKADKIFLVFPTGSSKKKNINDLINFLKYRPDSPIAGIIQLTDEKLTWYGAQTQSERPLIIMQESALPKNTKKITLFVEAEHVEHYKTQNVVGRLSGKSDSTVVITAHYDHLGRMGKNVYFPGANDNASGTAFLLDMARHYSKKDSLPYTMVFVAFAAEEVGLLGSKYFVENPLIPLNKIKFLLNFDLAGTGDEGIQVVNGSIFKEEYALLLSLNDENQYLPQVKVRGEACNSDHCPFYEKGVPSFFIYTLGGIKAYHDIEDVAKTLPLTEYEDYFKLITRFIGEL